MVIPSTFEDLHSPAQQISQALGFWCCACWSELVVVNSWALVGIIPGICTYLWAAAKQRKFLSWASIQRNRVDHHAKRCEKCMKSSRLSGYYPLLAMHTAGTWLAFSSLLSVTVAPHGCDPRSLASCPSCPVFLWMWDNLGFITVDMCASSCFLRHKPIHSGETQIIPGMLHGSTPAPSSFWQWITYKERSQRTQILERVEWLFSPKLIRCSGLYI